MERVESNKRRINSRFVAARAFFARRRVESAIAITLGAALLVSSGCRALFVRDESFSRFEPNSGRYINGADAAADWNVAREASVGEKNNRQDSTTTRGAEPIAIYNATSSQNGAAETTSEQNVGEGTSWNRRLQNMFRVPSFRLPRASSPAREPELANADPYAGNGLLRRAPKAHENAPYGSSNGVSENDGARRVVDATSEARVNDNKRVGFWAKLFNNGQPQDDFNEALVPSSLREGSNRAPHELVKRPVPQNNARVAKTKAPTTRERSSISSVSFGKQKASKRQSWNDPGAAVSQFDRNNFLPPVALVRSYYDDENIPVDPRALRNESRSGYFNVADTRPSLVDSYGPKRFEKTASLPDNSYRSRSYAPNQGDSTNALPESPENASSSSNSYDDRIGAATITPIQRRPNSVAQTSGRAKNFGSVRPIKIELPRESSVAQTSFQARTPSSSGSLRADSLFGWNAENDGALLSAFTAPIRYNHALPSALNSPADDRDVDPSFKDALGSRRGFDWFESNGSLEPKPAQVGDQRADGFFANDEPVFAPQTPVADADGSGYETASPNSDESSFDMSRFPFASEETASVPNGENAVDPSLDDVDRQVRNDVPEASEMTYEEELDNIIDVAINREYEEKEDERSVAPVDRVDDEPSTLDLVDAIAESVDPKSASNRGSDSEELQIKATELNASAPESLDARKSESASAAPLTDEEIAWVEQIKSAIQALLREREDHKRRGDDVRICDARLRLLYLVIGEYERSIQEIQDDSDPLKTFWEKECRGLETLLQNQLEEIDPVFVAERLRSGLDSFSGLCKLQIRRALLAVAPACYGLFEQRIAPYRRGETAYAYAELDYITSVETDAGYEINVECRWRLLDREGREVAPFETQRCENVSETKLRDVVLNVSVPLPDDLVSDVYLLELEVVDLNSSNLNSAKQRLTLVVADSENDGAVR